MCVSSFSCWCHFEWVVIVLEHLYNKRYTFHHLVEAYTVYTHGERNTERNRGKIHWKIFIFFIHSIPSMPLCVQFCWFFLYHSLDAYKLLSFLCCSWNLCLYFYMFFPIVSYSLHSFFTFYPCLLEFVRSFLNVYYAKPLLLFSKRKVVLGCANDLLMWKSLPTPEKKNNEWKRKTSQTTKRMREQEYKYFRWRMFWMRCKFGKLMKWIKEMQKCDRCELEKKNRKSIERNLQKKIHAPARALFSVLLMWCVRSFFFISLLHAIVKKCITFLVAVRYTIPSRRFSCIDCLKSDKSVFRLHSCFELLFWHFHSTKR